jgi:hypothetical protein
MMTLIRSFFQEPLLSALVLLCLILVGGLMLSSWAEKRRTRKFLEARAAARRTNLAGGNSADLIEPATGAAAARSPVFKLFRWEFVLLSVVLATFVIPKTMKPTGINAKSPAEPPSAQAGPSAAAEVHLPAAQPSSDLFAAELKLSLNERENFSLDLGLDVGGEADPDSLFLFESDADWDGLSAGTYQQIRGDYLRSRAISSGSLGSPGNFARQ